MPIGPRYRRVSALQRQFFDRESVLAAYEAALDRLPAGPDPQVFNVVGIGGIGKSRLLQELRNRTGESYRTARLDLQVPALRQQEDALAVLRTEFGAQGVKFDRFDIAYAVLWQRVHPQLRMDRSSTPFAEQSDVLSKILDDAMGFPVFGTAAGLVRLTDRALSNRQRKQHIKSDPTLQDLDNLSNAELGYAVSYLLAEELREASGDRPFVLYVDAYEALVPTPLPGGKSFGADAWLRDLLGQLQGGLTVVASREPLQWAAYDEDWAAVIQHVPVEGLPMDARIDLLSAAGITEGGRQRSIAEASAGVPFYLHLAIDTYLQNPARLETTITSEHIVQRFLQHVPPDEVRILELLSVARTFDFGAFRALGRAFNLPAHLLTWESLTAYSFAYPLSQGWYRLHQLMVAALQSHLSPAVKRAVHDRLRAYWEEVADRLEGSPDRGGVSRSSPLREAVYHGLHAEAITAERIHEYADRGMAMGGRQVVDGIVKDLRDYLAARPGGEGSVREAADCLEAESLLSLGNARAVIELAPEVDRRAGTAVSARLSLAAANARRIAGESRTAARIFQQVWEEQSGSVRVSAGFCLADIRMWQGDFAEAFELAEAVYGMSRADKPVVRADVKRLLHLGHRFLLSFDAAADLLAEAEAEYRRAEDPFGLANIRTNRAELLVFTDPEAAVAEAAAALTVQRELGAQHEIGKAYTAMAMAQIRLGQPERASSSFLSAYAALDRAGYRSGRARADMYRAFLLLQQGDRSEALSTWRRAVAEFEACDVYPSLVMTIHRAAVRLGEEDGQLAGAALRARAGLRPLGTLDALEHRTDEILSLFLGAAA
ncbi:hypothetical protein [Streptomyces endophytica]|uniref:Uncharacterized protein n=1 Tax=Streptomyces endophytica TaxID=2991496 RepID=A0ABY6P7W5_9ACTN|nr:hypothetical protein [Streptomyces endophytica]UZJ29876.1 hypothetical protein OJ254_04760 [Streptomyces endophytica]